MAVLFIVTNLGLFIGLIVITLYPFLIPVAMIGLIFWIGHQQKQEKKRHQDKVSRRLEGYLLRRIMRR